MRLDFGIALLAATLSNAVSFLVSGLGFVQVPLTIVNKSAVTYHKRQAGTPLYNPDDGLDCIVHRRKSENTIWKAS
jgi:hypothetical protein